MTDLDYTSPASLHLGSTRQEADAQGARTFRTAAQALQFALEEAAPVSLRGARLSIGDRHFSGHDLHWLYRSADYPLRRKQDREAMPELQWRGSGA